MSFTIRLHLDPSLYVRDPEETDLGRRIVDAAIRGIDEQGFEKFTFKKLADSIGSTEASVYRYFRNKHRLLLYLMSWYWSWVSYRVAVHAPQAVAPRQRLSRIVEVLLESTIYDPTWSHIDEVALHRLVVVEGNKAYQTRWVDDDNAEGLFVAYKELCEVVGEAITATAPQYRYPQALASTLVEASHQQIFFAQHLQRLTELRVPPGDFSQVRGFLDDLLNRVLELGVSEG
jgi:AcrR family transcriptional regulator